MPDLLITNGFLGAASLAAKRRIQVYHGTMVEHVRAYGESLPRSVRLRQTLGGGLAEAISGRLADQRVAVSESCADEVGRFYRLAIDAVIPNGVDTDLFRPRDQTRAREMLGLPPAKRIALFVGRLEIRKGADLLIPTCSRAGWQLAVAGPRAPRGAIHLGVLDRRRLALAYSGADCVLFPTRYEACSYVVLEALASGTPLVTSNVGWMATLLRDVPIYRGLIAEPDPDALAARLSWLAAGGSDTAVAEGRAYVCGHNSLKAFAETWLALI